jgi:hypothetical protein
LFKAAKTAMARKEATLTDVSAGIIDIKDTPDVAVSLKKPISRLNTPSVKVNEQSRVGSTTLHQSRIT